MIRRHFTFACEGATLWATLDEPDVVGALDAPPARSGLLIVTGGNEVRSGAWSGQAQLAARIAAEGYPVLRFDRRGVGDSAGPNGEFRSSGPDIAAALAAFRAQCPQLVRVVAFGNCDAASALMLEAGAGCDALVLSNPWTIEQADEPAPPSALRDHYRRRLADPAALWRLLKGEIPLGRLFDSLWRALRPSPPGASGLAQDMASGLARFTGPVRLLVAERDRTAQVFLSRWPPADTRLHRCPEATHSFVEPSARVWLSEQLLDALKA